MRKLVRSERAEQITDRALPLAVAGHRAGGHRRERVVNGDDEHTAAPQHTVDLAEHPGQVGFVIETVAGHDGLDRATGRETQIGEIAVMALDGQLGPGGGGTQIGDAIRVRIEGDRLGPLGGQVEGVAPDAELDHPFPADVAEQPQAALIGDAVAVGHLGLGHGVSVVARRPRAAHPA